MSRDIKSYIMDRVFIDMNSGCWLWEGALTGKGYASCWMAGRYEGVHRLSYKNFIGCIPTGLFVCHRCDVRSCVNPAHLFLGTTEDNMRDMVEKGRSVRGVKQPNSKLTLANVVAIKASRETCVTLAKRYGVGKSIVSAIRTGKNWRAT